MNAPTKFVVYVWFDWRDGQSAMFLSDEEGDLLDSSTDLADMARSGKTHTQRQTAGRLLKKLSPSPSLPTRHSRVFDTWKEALRYAQRRANQATSDNLVVTGIAILPEGAEPPLHMERRYENCA